MRKGCPSAGSNRASASVPPSDTKGGAGGAPCLATPAGIAAVRKLTQKTQSAEAVNWPNLLAGVSFASLARGPPCRNFEDFEGIVDAKKFERIFMASEIFLSKNPDLKNFQIRFDIIFVSKDMSLHHIKNISL